MSRYRKKPVVIEAALYDGDLVGEPSRDHPHLVVARTCPEWFPAIVREEDALPTLKAGEVCWLAGGLYIGTLEGPLRASPGDWIIRGTKGELYPCKPEVFADVYEPA